MTVYEFVFGAMLVLIGLSVIGIFLMAVLSNSASDTRDADYPRATQNLNVSGHVRHTHKDINSY